jgi:ankyrin repeat protein
MLTLEEILSDVAVLPEFRHLNTIKIDSRSEEGETPLHWMAVLGDAIAIKILIDNGAVIDATDNNGNTSLHEATLYRQTLAVSALLDLGASAILKNKDGMTTYDIAKEDNFEPIKRLFEQSCNKPKTG